MIHFCATSDLCYNDGQILTDRLNDRFGDDSSVSGAVTENFSSITVNIAVPSQYELSIVDGILHSFYSSLPITYCVCCNGTEIHGTIHSGGYTEPEDAEVAEQNRKTIVWFYVGILAVLAWWYINQCC